MKRSFSNNCVFLIEGVCLFGNKCDTCTRKQTVNIVQLQAKDVSEIRTSILKKQKGACAICKRILNDDVNACLDHDHKKKIKGTGQIRGVLCRTCNSLLAKSENNATRFKISRTELPTILRNMADYLDATQYRFMHPSEKPKSIKLQKSSYAQLKKVYKGKAQFPAYPKSGTLTVLLEKLFNEYNIVPKFYGEK